MFGPAKWLRFLITPPAGRALMHRDYCQQEVRIAAVLSGDSALLEACESGDVYLGIAEQLGFLPDSMNDGRAQGRAHAVQDRRARNPVRAGLRSLAVRTGISLFEAGEILARLRARFRRFEAYAQSVRRSCRPALWKSARRSVGACNARPASIRAPSAISRSRAPAAKSCTWPAFWRSGAGSSWSLRFTMRSWPKARSIRPTSWRPRSTSVMGDAAAMVLRGYRLPTDCQIIRPGERYFDDRGEAMWSTVTGLLAKLERETA